MNCALKMRPCASVWMQFQTRKYEEPIENNRDKPYGTLCIKQLCQRTYQTKY